MFSSVSPARPTNLKHIQMNINPSQKKVNVINQYNEYFGTPKTFKDNVPVTCLTIEKFGMRNSLEKSK